MRWIAIGLIEKLEEMKREIGESSGRISISPYKANGIDLVLLEDCSVQTIPPVWKRAGKEQYLRNPVVVTIGTLAKAMTIITQHVMWSRIRETPLGCRNYLMKLGDKKAIVIYQHIRKNRLDIVSKNLDKEGYRLTPLTVGSHRNRGNSALRFRTKRTQKSSIDLSKCSFKHSSVPPELCLDHEASKFKQDYS
nr:DEAD-box ATP-dependent RNA helicase 21 [Ipomoea batatas]